LHESCNKEIYLYNSSGCIQQVQTYTPYYSAGFYQGLYLYQVDQKVTDPILGTLKTQETKYNTAGQSISSMTFGNWAQATQKSDTSTYNSDGTKNIETVTEYNSSGLVMDKTQTQYAYDTYGNITSENITTYDSKNNITSQNKASVDTTNTGTLTITGNNVEVFNQSNSVVETTALSTNDLNSMVTNAGNDTIQLGNSITKNNIALFMQGSNLLINYAGTEQITIQNQTNPLDVVGKIKLSDGTFLTNTDINTLISNMSSFATNHGIQLTSIDSVRDNADLMAMISKSWHS